MIFKFKHILVFIFIGCLLTLSMQSAIVSSYKIQKPIKISSLNQPTEEEEEHSGKKASDGDELYFELNSFCYRLQTAGNLVWPITKSSFIAHTSDILIPPPKA